MNPNGIELLDWRKMGMDGSITAPSVPSTPAPAFVSPYNKAQLDDFSNNTILDEDEAKIYQKWKTKGIPHDEILSVIMAKKGIAPAPAEPKRSFSEGVGNSLEKTLGLGEYDNNKGLEDSDGSFLSTAKAGIFGIPSGVLKGAAKTAIDIGVGAGNFIEWGSKLAANAYDSAISQSLFGNAPNEGLASNAEGITQMGKWVLGMANVIGYGVPSTMFNAVSQTEEGRGMLGKVGEFVQPAIDYTGSGFGKMAADLGIEFDSPEQQQEFGNTATNLILAAAGERGLKVKAAGDLEEAARKAAMNADNMAVPGVGAVDNAVAPGIAGQADNVPTDPFAPAEVPGVAPIASEVPWVPAVAGEAPVARAVGGAAPMRGQVVRDQPAPAIPVRTPEEVQLLKNAWIEKAPARIDGVDLEIDVPDETFFQKTLAWLREKTGLANPNPDILIQRAISPKGGNYTADVAAIRDTPKIMKTFWQKVKTGEIVGNIDTLENAAQTIIDNLHTVGARIGARVKDVVGNITLDTSAMAKIDEALASKTAKRSPSTTILKNFKEDMAEANNIQDAFNLKKVYQNEIRKLIKNGEAGDNQFQALSDGVKSMSDQIDDMINKANGDELFMKDKATYALLKQIADNVSRSALVDSRRAMFGLAQQINPMERLGMMADMLHSPLQAAGKMAGNALAEEMREISTRGGAWKAWQDILSKEAIAEAKKPRTGPAPVAKAATAPATQPEPTTPPKPFNEAVAETPVSPAVEKVEVPLNHLRGRLNNVAREQYGGGDSWWLYSVRKWTTIESLSKNEKDFLIWKGYKWIGIKEKWKPWEKLLFTRADYENSFDRFWKHMEANPIKSERLGYWDNVPNENFKWKVAREVFDIDSLKFLWEGEGRDVYDLWNNKVLKVITSDKWIIESGNASDKNIQSFWLLPKLYSEWDNFTIQEKVRKFDELTDDEQDMVSDFSHQVGSVENFSPEMDDVFNRFWLWKLVDAWLDWLIRPWEIIPKNLTVKNWKIMFVDEWVFNSKMNTSYSAADEYVRDSAEIVNPALRKILNKSWDIREKHWDRLDQKMY